MVNLEVWIPPEINTMSLLDVYHVRECGSIAPPGRFGWFVPLQVAGPVRRLDKWWTPEIQDLHWTLFRNPAAAAIFSVRDKNDFKLIEKYSLKDFNTGE